MPHNQPRLAIFAMFSAGANGQGRLTSGRPSTVDLLIEEACFVKKSKCLGIVCFIKRS